MYAITIISKKQWIKDGQKRRLEVIETPIYLEVKNAGPIDTLNRARMAGMMGDIQIQNQLPEGAVPFECASDAPRPTFSYTSNSLYAR